MLLGKILSFFPKKDNVVFISGKLRILLFDSEILKKSTKTILDHGWIHLRRKEEKDKGTFHENPVDSSTFFYFFQANQLCLINKKREREREKNKSHFPLDPLCRQTNRNLFDRNKIESNYFKTNLELF